MPPIDHTATEHVPRYTGTGVISAVPGPDPHRPLWLAVYTGAWLVVAMLAALFAWELWALFL